MLPKDQYNETLKTTQYKPSKILTAQPYIAIWKPYDRKRANSKTQLNEARKISWHNIIQYNTRLKRIVTIWYYEVSNSHMK